MKPNQKFLRNAILLGIGVTARVPILYCSHLCTSAGRACQPNPPLLANIFPSFFLNFNSLTKNANKSGICPSLLVSIHSGRDLVFRS